MKIYVGVTDKNWYEMLSREKADEVNFWNPGGTPFKVLQENELFLFKLHYPENCIVGGGFFVRYSVLPPFLAWEAFGRKNGTESYSELIKRIEKYRKSRIDSTTQIGCTILTEPFWFDREDWIPAPDWSPNIVKGKTFDTASTVGMKLYQDVQERLHHQSGRNTVIITTPTQDNRFSTSLTKHRLGQGAFRIEVTEAYQRRCAVTGEKTLPVLEAAHIMPYSENGPHTVVNGLLLKSDIHTLFDKGYITLTDDYHVEVSRHLHDDYGNGKDYYKYHGKKLLILPEDQNQRPDSNYLEWHNRNVYLG